MSTQATTISSNGFTCPLPLRRYPQIVLGHGSGGQMMNELIEHLFVPAFARNGNRSPLTDGAVLSLAGLGNAGQRLVVSTDSFVVNPLFFPGGDIGSLAVHGTVNDLAMMGAQPLFLTSGFILEEGLAMEQLGQIVQSMALAARECNVQVVTGDTKVVERGHGDGLYINTTGIGLVRAGIDLSPCRIEPSDAILVSGNLGDHGIAIMSKRAGLQFETEITSDSAPLHTLVAAMLAACPDIHVLRDLTRGGFSAAVNEIARDAQLGMRIDERSIPIQPAVANACEMLGLDPLYVANEGKLLAILPAPAAEAVLHVMRAHPLGKNAAIVGAVTAEHPGVVVARTQIGSQRVIDLPAGELLPRIC